MLQGEADVVETAEQTVATERFDLERDRKSVLIGEQALFEVGG